MKNLSFVAPPPRREAARVVAFGPSVNGDDGLIDRDVCGVPSSPFIDGNPAGPRILLVSAGIGQGHNAAAEALREAARRVWPGCRTRRVDILSLAGRLAERIVVGTYRFEVTRVPVLYEWFHFALRRWRWFARPLEWLAAGWAGTRLRPVVDEFQPDLVIATFPVASAALARLRRRGRLTAPAATFVSDFASEPFWAYSSVDVHFVPHQVSVPALVRRKLPGPVRVAAPPVRTAFRPGDRTAARRRTGLRPDAFVVLVTGGAWGVGRLEDAARTALELGDRVQVVAACGHNEDLRQRVAALGDPDRVVALGWTEQMADLMAAADVVVTNGGGVSSMEACMSARPLIVHGPIAGHGRMNAALMAEAGLAIVADTPAELAGVLDRFARDEVAARRQGNRQHDELAGRSLDEDLRWIAGFACPALPRWRVVLRRSADAVVAVALLAGAVGLLR